MHDPRTRMSRVIFMEGVEGKHSVFVAQVVQKSGVPIYMPL